MIALLQRVNHASVEVDGQVIGEIGKGLLIFLGVEKGDTEENAEKLVKRFLGYRVFADDQGKMNNSVTDISGSVLVVPQFTLAADTKKGMRPSFSSAAPPDEGQRLYCHVTSLVKQTLGSVETGSFGADMQVHLQNDGPVTFWLSA